MVKQKKIDLSEHEELSVVLVKPDGVKRRLIGEIIGRFEKVELQIVAMKMIWVGEELARKHYPTTRKGWLKFIGERALEGYKEYGRDPGEDIEDLDPLKIGEAMAGYLVDYLTEGPVVAMLIRGENAIGTIRKIVGHTFGDKAIPGTIRGDYTKARGYMGFVVKGAGRNLIHASGNAEEADFERKLWFKEDEIYDY